MATPQQITQWVTNQDGLDNLKQETVSMPQPTGDDQVLVKIHTVALNFRDTEVSMGEYGHHKSVSQSQSLVPCSDMCGSIVSGHPTLKPGTRVMATFNQSHVSGQIKAKDMVSGLGLPLPGVLTQYRYFPAHGLVEAPAHLSDEQAACLPIAAVTAWMAINWQSLLGQPATNKGDEYVLLQGTGGVAISGLQIAHAAGFKTIITSSSDEKLEKAKKMGADFTINYRSTPNWAEKVMRLTNDEGAHIIFENGGAQTLRQSFDAVAFGGSIACIGYLGGKEDAPGHRMNTNVLALKRNVTLKGMLNGPRDRFEEMVAFYEKHGIKPVIDRAFTFGEAKEALKYLYSGSHLGKVVVKVAE